VSMTLMTTVKPDKGETILIPCNNTSYSRDRSFDAILSNCLQEMEKSKNGVLLLERGRIVDSNVLSTMVEIIFK
jgi:hypothetical protein